jgi:hypothetical protein
MQSANGGLPSASKSRQLPSERSIGNAGESRDGRPSVSVHIKAVRSRVCQYLHDVDARTRQRRRCPQRRIDSRTTQIRLVQAGADCPCAAEIGTAQYRFAQIRFHQTGLSQPAATEIDAAKVITAEHRQGEIHLVEGRRPQPALSKHRAQHAALTKYTVPQYCPFELAVAKSRCAVLRLGKIDAAEIAVAKHYAFSVQPAQILVAEILANKLLIGPCCQRGQPPAVPEPIDPLLSGPVSAR